MYERGRRTGDKISGKHDEILRFSSREIMEPFNERKLHTV